MLKDECEEGDTLALGRGGKAILGADNPTLFLNSNLVEPKIQIQIQKYKYK